MLVVLLPHAKQLASNSMFKGANLGNNNIFSLTDLLTYTGEYKAQDPT